MDTSPLIGLVYDIKPRIDNNRKTSIDVEQSNNFLCLSRSVDVKTRHTTFLYCPQRPLYNISVNSLSSREAIVRRPIRRLDHKNITVFRLRCLRCESVDTVDVASIQYRRVRSFYEKLG